MANELVTISAATMAQLAGFSAASPEFALRRPLAELVEATLQAAARSVHTRRAYQTAIGLFLKYLDGQERTQQAPADWRPLAETHQEGKRTVWEYRGAAAVLRLVDAGLLDGFRVWRENQGDGPNATASRMYAVQTFLRVALRDGVLTQDQADAIGLKPYRQRQKRDQQPVGRRLAKAEVKALRAAVDTTRAKGKRDLAILDAMLYAGLRREETASLDLSDFRQDGGRWWLVLSGKGQKTRRVKVADALFGSLTGWLEAAGLCLGWQGAVFCSVKKSGQITQKAINASVVGRLVAEYGHKAGLAPLAGDNRLSAHDLRRTAARNAYVNGAKLLMVQAMLGHSDPSTTTRYIGADDDDASTAVDFVRY